MSVGKAELLVVWHIQHSKGEACGLRASGWSHTEETEGGSGGSSRSYQPRDFMPEYSERARAQLRRTTFAWGCLDGEAKSVLTARFEERGPNVASVPGLSEFSWLAETFPAVQRRVLRDKMTAHEVLRDMVKKSKDGALLEQCRAMVSEALELFKLGIDAFDREREEQKMRMRERRDAERMGVAA